MIQELVSDLLFETNCSCAQHRLSFIKLMKMMTRWVGHVTDGQLGTIKNYSNLVGWNNL